MRCSALRCGTVRWCAQRRRRHPAMYCITLAFHDADTDTDIVADLLARIIARMSSCRSACHRHNLRKSLEDVGVVECGLYAAY